MFIEDCDILSTLILAKKEVTSKQISQRFRNSFLSFMVGKTFMMIDEKPPFPYVDLLSWFKTIAY